MLARPEIERLAAAPLDELAQGLDRFTEYVAVSLCFSGVCRDKKDDKFLACAVEGRAHDLVSSDRDLLAVHAHQRVAISNSRPFLLALELYWLDAAALAERFGTELLSEIRAAIPLEPGTAARLA